MIHKFYNGKVILGSTIAPDRTAVYTENDKIIAVTKDEVPYDVGHDAQGNYISPGFIDIHIHGGNGHRFMDATVDAFLNIAEFHAKFGTTTMLPSMGLGSTEQYIDTFETYKKAVKENKKGANMPGIHMEAPYFAGAQVASVESGVRGYDKEEYTMLIEKYGDIINRWSAAPELPGVEDFAAMCRKHNIKLSLAHSDAEYERVFDAYDMGFECITHLYSSTSTVHRINGLRYAGIVEAAYMIDGMDVEIIADGKHLPEALLKFIVKHKGIDRISVVTDATRCAGMPDGSEKLFDNPNFIIEDGVAKRPDRKWLAGSVATTNRLVRNMINLAGVTVCDAVRMATANPARMAGLKDRGVIREGAYADILIFNDNIDIILTMINGNVVYEG